MPHATADDGVKLYFEETGSGRPVIFVHEFAGSYRSWEPQMRHFGRRYRCNQLRCPRLSPSDVPESSSSYSQARAADDILPCSTRLVRRRPISLACRWRLSRRSILASAIRTRPFPHGRRLRLRRGKRTSASASAAKRTPLPPR